MEWFEANIPYQNMRALKLHFPEHSEVDMKTDSMKIGDLVKYSIPLRDNEGVGVIVEIREVYRPDRHDCHEDMVVKYRVKWSEDTHPILLRGVNYFAGNRLEKIA